DAMDYTTKFLVGDHLSKERCEDECEKFLISIKECPINLPKQIHTDNSYDYPLPIRKIFGKDGIIHVFFPAWKKKFRKNQMICILYINIIFTNFSMNSVNLSLNINNL
ncbi:MAG: hypothetical protein COY74_02875, partial [Nitrosopumilales archaeon CG_4_10_14_0_8_um_filter_34_8]